jgi:hypothetical protein
MGKESEERLMALYRTSYLSNVFDSDRFRGQILVAEQRIRKFAETTDFDAIAFTGTSGSAFAYPLSFLLGMPLICVRKSAENNHYYGKVEGYLDAKSYIIVDDFISGGTTIREIIKDINKFYSEYSREEPVPVACYMYGTKQDVESQSEWEYFVKIQSGRTRDIYRGRSIPVIG